MEHKQLLSYFFLALFLFVVYQIVLILSPFFMAITIAAVLSFAFFPLHKQIMRLPKVNVSAASIITTTLVALIVIIPSTTIFISLMNETIELYQKISLGIAEGKLEIIVEKVRQFLSIEWVNNVWSIWNPERETITDLLLKGAKKMGEVSAIQLANLTKNIFVWIFQFFLVTILLFFFFRDGKKIDSVLTHILPLSEKNRVIVFSTINETFSAVIRGQIVTSIVQASLVGLTLWFLGLPLPLFFSFVAFMASLIPIAGVSSVWVPWCIYLFAVQDFQRAIILLVIGFGVISTSDNILKPLLIGEKTKLPIFLLFLGILGGLSVYGFFGVFIGPVVLSLFFALFEIYRRDYAS